MSGASGVNYTIALLKALKKMKGVETHLIMSKWAEELIKAETSESPKKIKELADFHYSESDMGASISSTSFKVDSMVVIPASVKTCAGIAHAYAGTLI
ncbi:3-octaprenyl-4-hydroxybenzoate carboxy-lyase, partial [Candidatus Micrarchaeota archaeon]|nr:3-octaprenyl-4-hydroxybenzoate carboxy-lyase [Candidatus Micrarchaeota archaeon]